MIDCFYLHGAARNGGLAMSRFGVFQGFVLFSTFAALCQAQTLFSNTNPITTPSTAGGNTPPQKASPYPSQISVSGLSGTTTHVTVSLNGWTENGSAAFPGDRDFMLVGPTGAAFEFFGGCGSFHTFINITV